MKWSESQIDELRLLAANKLVVTTIAGQSFTLWAGAPFCYPDSHSEIPLSAEARA